MKLITEAELLTLLESHKQLLALEKCRVDLWEGYDDALVPFDQDRDNGIIKQLLNRYETA